MQTPFKLEGAPNSPVLVFSNSLGSDWRMWDELTPVLLPYFRILRYNNADFNAGDKGRSISELGERVITLLDTLGIDRVCFCGLSMGGLVGQWLALHHPHRIKKLVLANTAAKIGTEEAWNTRIETVSREGLSSLADTMMSRWFTDDFHQSRPERVAETKVMFLQSDRETYVGCCTAVRDADFRAQLPDIAIPTLVVTGDEDPVTNVEHAQYLVQHIPGAQLKILPAKHLSATELPQSFAQMLIDFMVGETSFARGMHVRRTVLGDAHVDRANANVNSFNADFQEFITQYAWGEIWTRPGLSKHHRSLITIAMLIALNRSTELKMHLRAALHNGVTPAEIREVILQAGVYCGLPAANEAFHLIAQDAELSAAMNAATDKPA